MSGIFDKLEIPAIEEVIKKYEVPTKNNTSARNSLATRIKNNMGRILSPNLLIGTFLVVPTAVIMGFAFISLYRHENIELIVQEYVEDGVIDSDKEKKAVFEIMSDIATSNNARYLHGRVRFDEKPVIYSRGFYCGNKRCSFDKVEEWIKAYDQEHKGESK